MATIEEEAAIKRGQVAIAALEADSHEWPSDLFPKVPETDEEVYDVFRGYSSEVIRQCVAGIYKIRRLQGDDVLEAYDYALTAHIEAAGRRNNKPDQTNT